MKAFIELAFDSVMTFFKSIIQYAIKFVVKGFFFCLTSLIKLPILLIKKIAKK